MSCYLRHLNGLLSEAGIEVTQANRKDIDRVIHEALGIEYKDCPATWKRLKHDVMNDTLKRSELVRTLKEAIH